MNTAYRRSLGRGLAVALATLALCWPAFWNGYPLLFPDSFEYLGAGHGISMKLRGIVAPAWMYQCMRSEIYALSIFLLHGKAPLWPIAFVQAALTAWVLWLVVRSLCRHPLPVYLALTLFLCAGTSVAWYASYIMPDILGPLLYLGLYLLVFAPESLQRWERFGIAALACWGAASHSAHLLLAALLILCFTALWLARWPAMRGRGGRLPRVAAIVVTVVAAQMLMHARLYGRPTLFGNPPPFLMARLIGDGTGRLYLQQHCANLPWTVCRHVNDLPTDEADFLWSPQGIWQTASASERESLRREEMPLVLATLRSYPRQQMARSWSNFIELLTTVGPADFWSYDDMRPHLDFALQGLSAVYPHTRQAHNAMPQQLFQSIQRPVLAASTLVVFGLLPWFWRRREGHPLGLFATIVLAVPLNALLCGVISCNDPRLQDRVAWLVALLAGLMLSLFWQTGAQPQPEAGNGAPEAQSCLS